MPKPENLKPIESSGESLTDEDITTVRVDRRSFLARAVATGSVAVGVAVAAACAGGTDADSSDSEAMESEAMESEATESEAMESEAMPSPKKPSPREWNPRAPKSERSGVRRSAESEGAPSPRSETTRPRQRSVAKPRRRRWRASFFRSLGKVGALRCSAVHLYPTLPWRRTLIGLAIGASSFEIRVDLLHTRHAIAH